MKGKSNNTGDQGGVHAFSLCPGETEEQIRTNLRVFFQTKLEMPTDDVSDDEIEQVRRVRMRK